MSELDIKNQVYVDLLRDSGFKAVYADPQNKHHLINLLNNVLVPYFVKKCIHLFSLAYISVKDVIRIY